MKNKSIVLILAALFLSTSASYAVPQQKRSAPRVVSGVVGSSIGQIQMKSSDGNSTTSTDAWTDLPNATLKISVPRGQTAYIASRFTAESNCRATGAGAFGWCSARILVNNQEMLPAAGIGYAFDTPDNGDSSPQSTSSHEGHALERSSKKLGPGVYTVKVQYRIVGVALEQWIGDWHFTAKRIDP